MRSAAVDRDPSEFVIVGRVRRAHGIRGELVVEPITDAPAAIFAAGRRLLGGGAHAASIAVAGGAVPLVIERASPFKGGWIVKFDAIGDRTTAERWRDRYLLALVDELAPPGEDEVYYHDLLGMRVERADGTAIGTVAALYELPQGLALEVTLSGARTALLPYRPEIVTRVSPEERLLVVDPPEGLIE